MRIDDVSNREDYDGKISSEYYINRINEDVLCFNSDIPHEYNRQSPLSLDKIKKQINEALKIYEDYEVIVIASSEPADYVIDLPYKVIRNNTPEYDLYLLCNAKVLILSRSTFALISCFFGKAEKIYLPLWGLFVASGLGTKYDKNNYTYFY